MGNGKYVLLAIIVIVIFYFAISKHKKCQQKGRGLNLPYRCKLFNSEPVTLIAENHYYGKREGKCYEFLDYGSNMQIRRVSIDKCGESDPIKKYETIEDAEYIES